MMKSKVINVYLYQAQSIYDFKIRDTCILLVVQDGKVEWNID